MRKNIREVADRFLGKGQFVGSILHGSGHINETYRVTYDEDGRSVDYILQRVNHEVFRDPVSLMENLTRVVGHIRGKLEAAGEAEISRRVLSVIPTLSGESFFLDDEGGFWRVFDFIRGARTHDAAQLSAQAFQAGRAFGEFQMSLSDFPTPCLHETIPHFHHTPRRYEAFIDAVERDTKNRAKACAAEIAFLQARQGEMGVVVDALASGELKERITHNDTKFNNVMLDDVTGEAMCVIDLDTVMPGSVLYDFGDMVRTTTCSAMEDEKDLSKVEVELPMFQALTKGYLEQAAGFLDGKEVELLAFSGKLITLMLGLRFLTDHLEGDHYFRIHREHHNLDRARTQIKLVSSMEHQGSKMNAIVAQEARATMEIA